MSITDKIMQNKILSPKAAHWKTTATIICLIIPIILSIFLRIQPAYLPVTDDWAQNSVYTNIQNQLASQVARDYPTLPNEQRQAYAQREFQNYLEQNQDQIDTQIKDTSAYFKSRMQDENNQTYLIAIDPWLWYGMTKNYIKNGHAGTHLDEERKAVHGLRNGRVGGSAGYNPMITINLLVLTILSIFISGVTPLTAAFYFPLIFVTLGAIPIFFITKKLTNNLGGLVASILFVTQANLLGRTTAGFSDTDAFTVTMPLFVIWFFSLAIYNKSKTQQYIYSILTAISFVIFTKAWGGWWYTVDILLVSTLAFIVYTLIKKSKNKITDSKNIAKTTAISTLLFVLGIGLIERSIERVSSITLMPFTGALGFTQLKAVATTDVWPNVLTTVAELNTGSLKAGMVSSGNYFFFLLAILGPMLLAMRHLKNKQTPLLLASIVYSSIIVLLVKSNVLTGFIPFALLISLPHLAILYYDIKQSEVNKHAWYAYTIHIWILVMIYAATTSVRFSAITAPAVALGIGVFLAMLYETVSEWLKKNLMVPIPVSKILYTLVILFVLLTPIQTAYAVAKSEVPSMNDAWYDSLISIKNDNDDGIITSWWDFGHWFVSIAERRVTFDGGDQGNRIHWVGNSLLTDDKETNLGILRMLNCGQEEAYKTLKNHTDIRGDLVVNMLYDVIRTDKENASQILTSAGLTNNQKEEVLNLTHCEDLIPQYYIVSDDMIGKSGVWAHFGSWDFEKAAMYSMVKSKKEAEGVRILTEEFNMPESLARSTYTEIKNANSGDTFVAPWPAYRSSEQSCTPQGDKAVCGSIVVDVAKQTATYNGAPVQSLVMAFNGTLQEYENNQSQVPVSVLLHVRTGQLRVILADPALARSTFTRLYFYNGLGLPEYELLNYQRSFTGNEIYVYTVDLGAEKEAINESATNERLDSTSSSE